LAGSPEVFEVADDRRPDMKSPTPICLLTTQLSWR